MKLPDHILEKIISEIRFDFSGDKFAPKGKSKIPRVFYLGRDVIEKINNYGLKTSGQRHIKLLSKGKKVYMYVSPLFYNAIKGVERGRSSYEKEWRKPELTKLITDLVPGVVRGKMKKLVSPKTDPMLKMHNINFPFIVSNKDQTGYWVPAFPPSDKDIDTLTTGLYENKMKKSELRSLIKETYDEFKRVEKGSKEVAARKKAEEEVYGAGVDKGEALEKQKLAGLQEVMVGGEMVDPNIVSAIMAVVPTLVALGAAINWKEEIAAWVRQMKAKYAK